MLFISVLCQGQAGSPWTVDVGVRPHITFIKKNSFVDRDNKLGFDAHISPGYRISQKIHVIGQIGYRSFHHSLIDYSPAFACDQNGMGGFDIRNSFTEVEADYTFLSVGLGVRMEMLKKFFLQPMFAMYPILSQEVETDLYECRMLTIPSHTFGNQYVFEKGPVVFSLQVGRDFDISERLSIFISADYTRFLSNPSGFLEIPSSWNYYQVGLNIGGQYRFGD